MDLTIIIPSYEEPYLEKTIQGILDNFQSNFEIIVHIDKGEIPDISDPRITICSEPKPKGMRAGINYGLRHAKGTFIMKCDAHCVFDKGFDIKMIREMKRNWLMIPRRYALHASEWRRVKNLPVKDYHYLSFPVHHPDYGYSMFIGDWKERTNKRKGKDKYLIDDTMTFQGSCWLANRKYFMEKVGYLDDNSDTYSSFSGEQLEVGLKYWLKGGEVKVNKKTWYAHLFKNKRYYGVFETKLRDYKRDLKNKAGYAWATDHWLNNKEPNLTYKFEWLIDKFWPVPGWPDDKNKWKT